MKVPESSLARLFSRNLKVRPGERVLVLADAALGPREKPITALAARIAAAGRRLASVSFCAYPETGLHGIEPPVCAWRAAFGPAAAVLQERGLLAALAEKRANSAQVGRAAAVVGSLRSGVVDAALFVTGYSITHTHFRSLLTGPGRARAASMPGFEEWMFSTSMEAGLARMHARTRRVTAALDGASLAVVSNADGTDLAFSLRGRRAHSDTGLFRRGECGNLPAGESYVAPREGTARGTLAVRAGPQCVFRPPMLIAVSGGRAVRVTGGGRRGAHLRGLFRRHPACAVVAELGVGTNPGARIGANMLESEKKLGTVHIAFGDNASFGGVNRAPFHQDYLVIRPTLDLFGPSGRKLRILERGNLLL